MRKITFEHDISLIRLRTMLLRCLGASIKVCSLVTPQKSSNAGEEHLVEVGVDGIHSKNLLKFSTCIEELRETQRSCIENPSEEIPKVME